MLKTIPPTTSCGCGYFKTKCAEIHYQTTTFCIICIFCGVKTLDYTDFVEHFRRLHFEDFTRSLMCTSEPIVTPIFETRKPHHDPLEFGEREVTEDPDEVMKKLKQVRRKVEKVKTEKTDDFIVTLECNNGPNSYKEPSRKDELDEFNESDNEFLICKIKVEQADLQAANPTKPINPKRCSVNYGNSEEEKLKRDQDEKKDEYEEEENCTYPLINDNHNHNGNDGHKDYDESDDQNPTDVEGIVDWSQPYEPSLLKNHEKRPYKPRNKPNLCTYCGRTFKRRYQLETHLNVHTGEKPHQCEICGRLFRAVTTLTRHLNTHEERETYQCKFCKKAFTHKVALLSHELRHTQERTVPCKECDKWFYTVNQMDTHMRKVHNKNDQDDLPFVCDICSKSYRSGSMLSTHKFKKHYKMAKYSCELCGKKFVVEQHLQVHKRVHIDGFSSLNSLQSEKSTGQT